MSKPEPFRWRKAKPDPAPAPPSRGRVRPAAEPQVPLAAPAPTAEPPRPSPEQIAVLAYEIWEAQGRPNGADRDHWFEAELRLSASDPLTVDRSRFEAAP